VSVVPRSCLGRGTAQAHTLLRMCESDLSTASATYALLRHFGWQMINVMYSRDPFGRTFMETLSVLVEEGERLSVVDQVSFQPKDDADIELALRTLRGSSARVVVLASATVDDARRVMLRAHRHGMTGKGWTWIGACTGSGLALCRRDLLQRRVVLHLLCVSVTLPHLLCVCPCAYVHAESVAGSLTERVWVLRRPCCRRAVGARADVDGSGAGVGLCRGA
jgi:hypothetical protein